jgi:hypothetical protein
MKVTREVRNEQPAFFVQNNFDNGQDHSAQRDVLGRENKTPDAPGLFPVDGMTVDRFRAVSRREWD